MANLKMSQVDFVPTGELFQAITSYTSEAVAASFISIFFNFNFSLCKDFNVVTLLVYFCSQTKG
jgi:hypothetical protein